MSHLWIIAGLGLAGIDPVGMLLLLRFLTQGLSRRRAVLFGAAALLGTALLGGVLSFLLGSTVQRLSDEISALPEGLWVWFNVALTVALLMWGVYRLKHPEHHDRKADKTPRGMIPALLFLISTPLLDPTFVGMLAMASQHGAPWQPLADAFLWTLLSQSPLFLLTGAVMAGKHEKMVQLIDRFRTKNRNILHQTVTVLIFLSAAFFLADLIVHAATGIWMVR